jgi:hypothetical protein
VSILSLSLSQYNPPTGNDCICVYMSLFLSGNKSLQSSTTPYLSLSSRPLVRYPHLGRRSQGFYLLPTSGPIYLYCRYYRHLPALRCSWCASSLLYQKSHGYRGSLPNVSLRRFGHATRAPTQTSHAPAPSRKASFVLNRHPNRADYSHADVAPATSSVSITPAQDYLPNSTTACQENAEAPL